MSILNQILEVSNSTLDQINTSHINNYSLYHDISYYHGQSGREHYRLLMYISSLFNNSILFDIGTNKCMSALALSNNNTNKVKTYDIIKVAPEYPSVNNIEYILGDSTEDKNLINSNFVFLDVAHDGTYEDKFYDYLRKINWKGFLLLDDIHLNDPMKTFWNRITEEKYDLTGKGHWSGTGLVVFRG
jgi:hypothetical protein